MCDACTGSRVVTDSLENPVFQQEELGVMQVDQHDLFNQLTASWNLVTELKADLTKWEEREQYDERDRETLMRRLTKVIGEKQELERNMERQHENVMAENMFLSNENTEMKNKLKNFEQRLKETQQERQQYKDTQDENNMLMKENLYLSEQSQEMKDDIHFLKTQGDWT